MKPTLSSRSSLPLLALLALLACPSGDTGKPPDSTPTDSTPTGSTPTGTTDPPDPDTVALAGSCSTTDDLGGFSVIAREDETTVDGQVADGVVPANVLEQIAAEGDCVVWRRNNPYCEPSCDPGETCDFDGTCLPYPSNQDLGTVSLSGLVQPVVMEPVFPGNTYYDTELPHPAIVPGALLTLSMPGGVYGPVTLYGVGIESLDMTGITWRIASGVDYTVTWPAPTGAVVRSEVVVQMSIDQHGVSPSALRCTFADDGEAVVPGALLATLVDVGVTGFPSATLERRTADRATVSAGCFDLVVTAPRTVPLEVEGHTPCVSDLDCPDGQDCNEELQTCG